MIEIVYFSVAATLTLIALINWRVGLYLAIFLDVARDPIRKLSESQSVWMTVGGVAIWGGVFLGALLSDGRQIRSLFQRYRRLPLAFECFLLALVPGCILSLTLYTGGYKLAVIGVISYVAPCIGVAVGFLIPMSEADVNRVLRFYTAVNAVALLGTLVEYSGVDHRVLGGIDMEWLRYRQGYTVELIAGIYRSPDIMGLHAAHVVIFSLLLAHRSPGVGKAGWAAMACWGLVCLLLSGRRKMLGIPLVFVASFVAIGMLNGSRAAGRLATFVAILSIGGGLFLMTAKDVYIGNEYANYAATLFGEGLERGRSIVGSGVVVTLYQSGVLGSGIGSVTQGAHYANVKQDKNWQEDGVSRMFKELGVPGVLLMGIFLVLIFRTISEAVSLIPSHHPLTQLQIGLLSCVIANGASFAVSHQQYSGDPGSGILVLLMLGMVLGMPRIYARQSRLMEVARARRLGTPEVAAS